MSRRKGELSAGEIDRGWPYQVALPSEVGAGLEAQAMMTAFCKKLLRCDRGHSVFYEDRHYNVHCFAVKAHAEMFMEKFGGEWCDPRERGKGANWSRWNKGSFQASNHPPSADQSKITVAPRTATSKNPPASRKLEIS